VLALAAVVACGGDGDVDGRISEAEAERAAGEYFTTTLGLFTGSTDSQAYIDLFAPECRDGVDTSVLDFVLLFMQALAPELSGIKVEAVEVGALVLEHTEEGTLVTPEDPDALRLKVDGTFVSAADFFARSGFEPSDDTDLADPVLLVKREGKVYLGDCSELEGLTGAFG
jgi:hypothetical protein